MWCGGVFQLVMRTRGKRAIRCGGGQRDDDGWRAAADAMAQSTQAWGWRQSAQADVKSWLRIINIVPPTPPPPPPYRCSSGLASKCGSGANTHSPRALHPAVDCPDYFCVLTWRQLHAVAVTYNTVWLRKRRTLTSPLPSSPPLIVSTLNGSFYSFYYFYSLLNY